MNETGLCECGCGERTKKASRTIKRCGWEKGQPVRFIRGHHHEGFNKMENNPRWNGGHTVNPEGYDLIKMPDHPRADNKGYVFNHVLVAEKAIGHFLPKNVQVHHFPDLKHSTALVICENQFYHDLLHLRYRALKACGHKDWKQCEHCKCWDSSETLSIVGGYHYYHKKCRAQHSSAYKASKTKLHLIANEASKGVHATCNFLQLGGSHGGNPALL